MYKGDETKMREYKCIFCNLEFQGHGNNPNPVEKRGRCCNNCNATIVIPARIKDMEEKK